MRLDRPTRHAKHREARRRRVLTQGIASITQGIADALVCKDLGHFFLCDRNGQVPLGGGHGLGLYYRDCRYLSGFEVDVAGGGFEPLVATVTDRGAVIELINRDLAAGADVIPKETIILEWTRRLDGTLLRLEDRMECRNFRDAPAVLPVSVRLVAAFEDIFAVRGMYLELHGRLRQPVVDDDALVLSYLGADHLERTAPPTKGASRLKASAARRGDRSAAWLTRRTRLSTDSLLLSGLMDRSLRDLATLRTTYHGAGYLAAGVPWFVALFGRDSLISALQVLAFDPTLAADTLRILAELQGDEEDESREEEPGKILHELRLGESANLHLIPQTPYYGSIDATLLFLILLARHANWTGDLALFHEVRSHIDAALGWIDRYGDTDGDGYLDYRPRSNRGLVNQGWKDSGDAIVNADGSLARPPIALVEVQAYTYAAWIGVAELLHRAGEREAALRLERRADDMRDRFERDFWLPDRGTYALALQAEGEPVAVVASNAGHALWAGIADPDRAASVATRLTGEDAFSGWGIRTLSTRERRYSPIGYHLGTVWPHDNSLIVAGLRRYGQDAAAALVATGLIEAAAQFDAYRLPELFAGFGRDTFDVPVRYPVACHPQAWAAGSVPHLIESLLGLVPEAFEARLRIVRPILPRFVHDIEISDLRIGSGMADLRFSRTHGSVRTEILKAEKLDVIVQDEGPRDEHCGRSAEPAGGEICERLVRLGQRIGSRPGDDRDLGGDRQKVGRVAARDIRHAHDATLLPQQAVVEGGHLVEVNGIDDHRAAGRQGAEGVHHD
jgi:glycogen debranching enzyme